MTLDPSSGKQSHLSHGDLTTRFERFATSYSIPICGPSAQFFEAIAA
jgi:hypothetical protein